MPTKPLTADLTPTAENVLRVFHRSSRAQMAEGLAWYHTAHALALSLDRENPLRAAGIISAFSPQTSWEQNVILAKRFYAGETVRHIFVGKAHRIMAGEDAVTVLNRPKTQNFALTIADPNHRTAVVIDRHAFDIAIAQVTDPKTRGALDRKGVYEKFANAYREAARAKGLSPAQMQASTWVNWRQTATKFSAANRKASGLTD
jgi:hypothetical protein